MGFLQRLLGRGTGATSNVPLTFTNTLSGRLETFTPPDRRAVRMYNCGPTVYGRQHIGNLSMYVFVDVLRRTLQYNGLDVKQVINITDVGHLASDADEGEDKMTRGLRAAGMDITIENMRTLGEQNTSEFLSDLEALNVRTKEVEFPRASDYIPAQIIMIQTLEEKGYVYETNDGVYFDTAAFPRYGVLGNSSMGTSREGRIEAHEQKRNPADFAVWKKDAKLGWKSPWGTGFPGWHIECSAMARSLLGEQIDIHTGGIEHIPIHHNNEIAQSESATGKRPFALFWLHRAHLLLDGAKIAKSEGNTVYLDTIREHEFHPLAFRYLLLETHYRKSSNFTWEALAAAQTALLRLAHMVDETPTNGDVHTDAEQRFHERINDDLDTPGALSLLWDTMRDTSLTPADRRATILHFDSVLGLQLDTPNTRMRELLTAAYGEVVPYAELPGEVCKLITERESARAEQNWKEADRLRDELAQHGYEITDTDSGTTVKKKARRA